jgi:hypothetical protein
MYYTVEDRLKDLKIDELLKIYNSNKEYIYFDISVFNAGARIKIILTNDYIKYSKYLEGYNWNGYDYILENNSDLFYTVEELLCKKFLSDDLNKLSKYKLNQLKKIYKNNNNKY